MDTIAQHESLLDQPSRAESAVVYGSIAMIAAAAGLSTAYEAGVAGWLSATAASATALLLYLGHRALTPSELSSTGPARAAHKAGARGARKTPENPTADALSKATIQAGSPAAPDHPPAAAVAQTAEFPAAPRQPTHGLPPPKQPLSLFVTRKSEPNATPSQADADLAQLDALVRQMAANIGGAKAETPDPDRLRNVGPAMPPAAPPPPAPVHDHKPAMRVGFGAPAVAADAGERVASAVAAQRLDVLLAPIQSLSEQRPSHFEISIRLRDEHDVPLTDAEVSEAARRTGLAGAIDALKLPRVARVARKVQARSGTPADVLAGVFGDSLTDKAFIDALDAAMAGPTAPPIVLAFSQADVRGFGRVHWWALATLADIGLHFAIADLTDLDLDFDLLSARGFRFAKLDAGVFFNGLPHGATVIPAQDLTRHLSSSGLKVIVGNIDADDQMTRVAACGVTLGQGNLFGAPKPVRREILEV